MSSSTIEGRPPGYSGVRPVEGRGPQRGCTSAPFARSLVPPSSPIASPLERPSLLVKPPLGRRALAVSRNGRACPAAFRPGRAPDLLGARFRPRWVHPARRRRTTRRSGTGGSGAPRPTSTSRPRGLCSGRPPLTSAVVPLDAEISVNVFLTGRWPAGSCPRWRRMPAGVAGDLDVIRVSLVDELGQAAWPLSLENRPSSSAARRRVRPLDGDENPSDAGRRCPPGSCQDQIATPACDFAPRPGERKKASFLPFLVPLGPVRRRPVVKGALPRADSPSWKIVGFEVMPDDGLLADSPLRSSPFPSSAWRIRSSQPDASAPVFGQLGAGGRRCHAVQAYPWRAPDPVPAEWRAWAPNPSSRLGLPLVGTGPPLGRRHPSPYTTPLNSFPSPAAIAPAESQGREVAPVSSCRRRPAAAAAPARPPVAGFPSRDRCFVDWPGSPRSDGDTVRVGGRSSGRGMSDQISRRRCRRPGRGAAGRIRSYCLLPAPCHRGAGAVEGPPGSAARIPRPKRG